MRKICVALVIGGLLCGASLLAEIRDEVRSTFQVSAGGTLRLNSDMGSIEIFSGESNLVEVVVVETLRSGDRRDFEAELANLTLDIHQEASDVIVTAEYRRRERNHGNSLNLRFLVTVPYRYNIDAQTAGGSVKVEDLEGEVDVRTAGGSLALGRIVGNVQGRTAGGSITLAGSSGSVQVETAGGSISIGEVEADVVAHTAGGSISVNEVYGAIDASTSGGSIDVSIMSQPGSDCRLTTSGGSVSVKLAGGVGVDLDAETGNGRVISDFGHVDTGSSDRQRRLRTRIGGGGPQLYVRTSGGDIRVREE